MPGVPVGAAIGERVGQQLAVGARHPLRQRDGGVVAFAIGIDEHARRRIERIGDVQDALILRAVVAHEEIFAAFALRNAEALVGPQLLEPFTQPRTLRQALEIGLRQRILRGHPVARCLRSRHLRTSDTDRHAHAVIDVDHVAARGRRDKQMLALQVVLPVPALASGAVAHAPRSAVNALAARAIR